MLVIKKIIEVQKYLLGLNNPVGSISIGHLIIFSADEKKQYDPAGFRDAILEGLNEAGSDLDAASKFLDAQSSKLDYRRYGVTLIEILIAGGLLGNYRYV